MKKTSKEHIAYGLMITAFVLVGTSMPFTANAVDTTYTPLAPLPCIPSPSSTYTDSNGKTVTTPALTCAGGDLKPMTEVNVNTYIQYTFNLLIALAAVAAVFMIVWGGFLYMTSDAMQNKKDGLTKIQHAVEGLLLVLCSFLILRTINPAFVNIPVGLVTPLNLSAPNINANWLNAINKALSVEDVNANNAATRDQVAKAAVAATALQQQLTTAQDALTQACSPDSSGNVDPVACQDAGDAVNTIQSQLIQLKSNTTFSVAKSTMDDLTIGGGTTLGHDCSATGDPQTCADQAVKIGHVYTSLSGQLQPDQVTQLASYTRYSTAIVNMEKQSALLYQQTAQGTIMSAATGNPLVSSAGGNYPKMYQDTLTSIKSAADAYINSPGADPALVLKLKTKQQNITDVVTTMRFHLAP